MWFDQNHLKFGNKITKRTRWKGLSKDVSGLIRSNAERLKMPASKWWRRRWQSISICFVRYSWKISLCAIWITLRLSQWMTVSEKCVRPTSSNSQWIERSLDVVFWKSTVFYLSVKMRHNFLFLTVLENKRVSRKRQNPIVERRKVGSLV